MRIDCHHCHENTALSIDVRCHGLVHPRTAALPAWTAWSKK